MQRQSKIIGLIIILSFLIAFSSSVQWDAEWSPTPEELDYYVNSITDSLPPGKISASAELLVEQAYDLATKLSGSEPTKCKDFMDKLLGTYSQSADKDFIIVYNSGGYGNHPIGHDDQWGPVVEKIESILEELGYACSLIEYKRTESGNLPDKIEEIKDIFNSYHSKAKRLASEVEFLTQNLPEVRVIITGLSQGAGYANEVMKLLETNLQVYSIEGGLPFFHEGLSSERVLNLNEKGTIPDALNQGNVWALTKAYLSAPFKWVAFRLQGNPRSLSMCWEPPGHIYHWENPEVRSQIIAFLENNFG